MSAGAFTVCPSARKPPSDAAGSGVGASGLPTSMDTLPPAAVTEIRGASIASWIVKPWSSRFNVTLNTELMIVKPPGEP